MATKLTTEKKKDLLSKFKSIGTAKNQDCLEDSFIFKTREEIPTDIPVLNIAFSGSPDGGFSSGITLFAGVSKSGKSFLSLCCASAYLKKYDDAICLFYDSEFGASKDYFRATGIDMNRVLHIPITNIEELLFDIVQKIENIERDEHVVIVIDSIGNLASKKEAVDALEGKSAEDMTRAKKIKSLFRNITPKLVLKNIPLFAINHVYQSMDFVPRTIVSGGQGPMLSADTVFVITKSQEKAPDKSVAGWNFTLNVDKSRKIKEKTKLTFQSMYDVGVNKYSGLLDIAVELGYVTKPKQGFYQKVNPETGEILDEKMYREKNTNTAEFWNDLLSNEKFKKDIEKKFLLVNIDSDGNTTFNTDDDSEGDEDDEV